jgi:hypothetical protein
MTKAKSKIQSRPDLLTLADEVAGLADDVAYDLEALAHAGTALPGDLAARAALTLRRVRDDLAGLADEVDAALHPPRKLRPGERPPLGHAPAGRPGATTTHAEA